MTNEQMMLARIRTENGAADVCEDEQVSIKVREKMLNQAWQLSEDDTENSNVFFDSSSVTAEPVSLEGDFALMAENKDIMWKIPPKTKFRFLKRVLNRLMKLTNRFQQEFNNAVFRQITALAGRVELLTNKLERLIRQNNEQRRQIAEMEAAVALLNTRLESIPAWKEDRDTKLAAIARETVRTKWRFVDYLESQQNEDREIRCGICGFTGSEHEAETVDAECAFDGGKLHRYVCPRCGAIFGPLKFSTQSPSEFDDDYTVHYTGYREGDSTEKEKRAFFLLNPTKQGAYLNYGCGSWSQTMKDLRSQGYQVYGYEPYSKDIDNPYIITDRNELKRMRFNGIFSNDVLEHFADPVSELIFMKSLLATPEAMMSHCTGCYHYKYEYTRFHMFFFTGNAVPVMCRRAGLSVVDEVDDQEADFCCKLFRMNESELDLMPVMMTSGENSYPETKQIRLQPGELVFGPYVTLPQGDYRLNIEVSLPDGKKMNMRITAEYGKKLLLTTPLQEGANEIPFSLREHTQNVEFVAENELTEEVSILKLTIR